MKKTILVLAAVLLSASLAAPASAQYPDRAVKMIVPWAAGGDTDNIFRPLAPLLQKHLGSRSSSPTSREPQARSAPARPRARLPTVTPSTPCTTTSTSCTIRA